MSRQFTASKAFVFLERTGKRRTGVPSTHSSPSGLALILQSLWKLYTSSQDLNLHSSQALEPLDGFPSLGLCTSSDICPIPWDHKGRLHTLPRILQSVMA